jgi:aminotransferase
VEINMEIKETVIRLMTRLAIQHGAVNLAQGFTDEAPVYDMVWGGIAAMLGGTDAEIERLETLTLQQILDARKNNSSSHALDITLKDLLGGLQNPRDQYNQYSFPFGIPALRQAIAGYTEMFYGFRPDPEQEITVVLGASEGMAMTLRAVCKPGDGVLMMQPFHEIYPAQARIFGLEPRCITLRENPAAATWELDRDELLAEVRKGGIRAIMFNTPLNPTGKVFSEDEMDFIAGVCRDYDILAITDEIYEHMVFDGHRHHCLATRDGMKERTIVVNSISKTGKATGWRVGWVLTPQAYTKPLRALHDNIAVQAPTPLQKGAVDLLQQDRKFFEAIAAHYDHKRRTLIAGLERVGFRVTPPQGAYYLFADHRGVPALAGLAPTDAAMKLIKEFGVASVPGDNFYAVGREDKYYLRFAFCRGQNTLEAAVAQLSRLAG